MSLIMEDSMRNKIVSCLSQQLSELEVLKSMYPNHDEIILTDVNILNNIQSFIEYKSEYTPTHLDFVLNLRINELKLEVCITLPTFYPDEEPDIYIRCNQLNRQQETSLNTNLSDFIKSNHLGEVCLYTIISWLQENITIFKITVEKDNNSEQQSKENKNTTNDMFIRLWIYSHHIYNKKKREEIVKKAKDLSLTGFCIPGKPGVICVEGPERDCKQWWRDIKSMCWKKIVIRKSETFEPSEQSEQQKFEKFEELSFHNQTSRLSKHSDMSRFSKFMEEHGLSQAFNEFFGLCKLELECN